MARAKANGPHGVDRWTSNGYGVQVGHIPDSVKKAAAEWNAQQSGAKKSTTPAKGKGKK